MRIRMVRTRNEGYDFSQVGAMPPIELMTMPAVRSKISLTTFALCLSLIAHGMLLGGLMTYYVRSIGRIHLPGYDRIAPQVKSDEAKIFIPLASDEQLGRTNARGDATDDSSGDDAMQARQADQNQSFLSLDPQGPGRRHAQPSQSQLPMQAIASQTNSRVTDDQTDSREIPFGVSGIQSPKELPGEIARGEEPNVSSPQASAPARLQSPEEARTTAAPTPPADPAPQANTESDPFSTNGCAEFRRGKLNVQLGRAHRITTPRMGLAGLVEASEIGQIELVLELTIDETGNVRQARIAKSSGSDNFDQEWRVAAYRWWFEPRKNEKGEPKDMEFPFTIKIL